MSETERVPSGYSYSQGYVVGYRAAVEAMLTYVVHAAYCECLHRNINSGGSCSATCHGCTCGLREAMEGK